MEIGGACFYFRKMYAFSFKKWYRQIEWHGANETME